MLLSDEERATFTGFAEGRGQTFSDLVRLLLHREYNAEQEVKKNGKAVHA